MGLEVMGLVKIQILAIFRSGITCPPPELPGVAGNILGKESLLCSSLALLSLLQVVSSKSPAMP